MGELCQTDSDELLPKSRAESDCNLGLQGGCGAKAWDSGVELGIMRQGSLHLNSWAVADRRQHLGLKEIYTTAPAGNKELFLKWLGKKAFSEFYTQLVYDFALKTQGCDSDRLI